MHHSIHHNGKDAGKDPTVYKADRLDAPSEHHRIYLHSCDHISVKQNSKRRAAFVLYKNEWVINQSIMLPLPLHIFLLIAADE